MKILIISLMLVLCSCKGGGGNSNGSLINSSIMPSKQLSKDDEHALGEFFDLCAYEIDKESPMFNDDTQKVLSEVKSYYNNTPEPLSNTFYISQSPIGTQFKIIKYNYQRYELDVFRFKTENSRSLIFRIIKVKYDNDKWSVEKEM